MQVLLFDTNHTSPDAPVFFASAPEFTTGGQEEEEGVILMIDPAAAAKSLRHGSSQADARAGALSTLAAYRQARMSPQGKLTAAGKACAAPAVAYTNLTLQVRG